MQIPSPFQSPVKSPRGKDGKAAMRPVMHGLGGFDYGEDEKEEDKDTEGEREWDEEEEKENCVLM